MTMVDAGRIDAMVLESGWRRLVSNEVRVRGSESKVRRFMSGLECVEAAAISCDR